MSAKNTEVETYFGRCRCCLSYGYLKNMWLEHKYGEETEVYGEMLIQCFALTWNNTEETMDQDQICEQCITRLRDASEFKKVVLDSQEELLQQIGAENESSIKVEHDDEGSLIYQGPESEADTADSTYTFDTAETDTGDLLGVKEETEYEDIEYLEEEDVGDPTEVIDTDSSLPSETRTRPKRRKRTTQPDSDEKSDTPKSKWPKRLPKTERFKTYKQYTADDFRECMETIRKGEMTPHEASLKYNIPKKTICAKLRTDPKDEEMDSSKEKTYRLIREIKSILTYTNATPYKSKNIRFYCAYCSTDGPAFEDPDDLRTHTRTTHVSDRTDKIEFAMRPFWMNEVLKLDIENLLCTVCCIVIGNWNEMFKHLKEKHKVILDLAYTRVIPYVLTADDLKCALCKEGFSNYMHLDGHMNAHYNNYVCDDCGDTFLSHSRLKQHRKIHDVGKFSCSMCSKVFTLEKYKRKHEELVHKQLSKYKCWYCPEKFTGEYNRHMHCLAMHKEKVKIITCELCGQSFTWRQYYLHHMKRKHDNVRRFQCSQCEKSYLNEYELKDHELRHLGQKNFECQICKKKYVSANSLKQHGKQHLKK